MAKKTPKNPASDFVPSDFMRARRPHLFSDSSVSTRPVLPQEVLEYQLDTLTSRKEETKFEHFARKLAEKEICPNLLPQTGPTGGGDSKVDSETYPVAGEIALRWYAGIDQNASKERWAFAFSAKQDWHSKVRADVESIVSTGRDYKKIFFITNQFVPDKKRSKTEDDLTRQFNVPLRILDRTWIVEKVLRNDRISIAIEALGLTQLESRTNAAQGQRDSQREKELRELDAEIDDVERYRGVEYQLAEAFLESAMLARGLERPRAEVEGRFGRAERVASDVGHSQQQMRIAYARAWTAFWWFDDFFELNRLYTVVEEFAKTSEQADDLELLVNLWQLVRSSVLQRKLDASSADLDSRTATLKQSLDRVAGNQDRPNNAALARTSRLIVDLSEALGDEVRSNAALDGLTAVVQSSDNLANYPIVQLSKMLGEVGDTFARSVSFDRLFEAITSVLERRSGEARAGLAFRERGIQKLQGNLPYEAIRLFGRAQHKLAKREYRGELSASLVGAALGYEQIGLLWAARSSVLAAAHYALTEFQESGAIIRPALRAVQKLTWIELQLGRIPCALAWGELGDILARHIEAAEGAQDDFADERQSRDMVLSMLLLRSDLEQLRQLEFLPVVLERLSLPHAQSALLYALGYEARMREDGWIPESETSDNVRDFYRDLVAHPASTDVPKRPDFLSEPRTVLRTLLLGCEIEVSAANEFPSIYLAEAILGALESFLATSLNREILPYRETFRISIDPMADVLEVPTSKFEAEDGPSVRIQHSVPIHAEGVEAQGRYSDWLMETVLRIITRFAKIRDVDAFMARVMGEERAFERSINTAHVHTIISNIMGHQPKLRLADWKQELDVELFPLQRDVPWNDGLGTVDEETREAVREVVFGGGEPPPELMNWESSKHSEIEVSAVIDDPLWNRAQWRATFFGFGLEGAPPILGLGFKNRDAAIAIFSDWERRFGEIDKDDDLRISILTGIDKENPATYRIIVGGKMRQPKEGKRFIVTASRINTMEPSDSRNLNNFVAAYDKAGRYVLVPAHFNEESRSVELIREHGIGKHEIFVRPMWQVDENDPDIVAVQSDDDPILPNDSEDVPIVRALKRVRSRPRD
jgi:hypothetical protein